MNTVENPGGGGKNFAKIHGGGVNNAFWIKYQGGGGIISFLLKSFAKYFAGGGGRI
jgi:hypothetical protein